MDNPDSADLSALPFNIENWYYYGTNTAEPLELNKSLTSIYTTDPAGWLNSPTPVSMDVLDPASSYTSSMKLEFAFNEFLSIDGTVTGATFTSVPEPATLGLLGLGGLMLRRRKKA